MEHREILECLLLRKDNQNSCSMLSICIFILIQKYWPDPKRTLDCPEFELNVTSIKEENFSPELIRRVLLVKGKDGDL